MQTWWLHILNTYTIFGDKGTSCKFWVIGFPKLNQNNSFKLPFEHHDNLQQLRHQFVSFHICHIRPWTSATGEKCSECQESTRMKWLEGSIFDGNHSCRLPARKKIMWLKIVNCISASNTQPLKISLSCLQVKYTCNQWCFTAFNPSLIFIYL